MTFTENIILIINNVAIFEVYICQQLQDSTIALQQTCHANATLQQQVQNLQEQSHKGKRREEIEMTVKVAEKSNG